MPKPELYKDSFVVHNLLEFNFWSHVPRINFSTDENKYHWLRQHCIKERRIVLHFGFGIGLPSLIEKILTIMPRIIGMAGQSQWI